MTLTVEELGKQVNMLRAQLAALTELLGSIPAADGQAILSPARHERLEELFDHHLRKLTSESGIELR